MERDVFSKAVIDRRYEDTCALLTRAPSEVATTTIHTRLGRFDVAREVAVEVHPLRRGAEIAHLPVDWLPREGRRWLPRLRAQVQLRPVGEMTELLLVGSYTPPLGFFGLIFDVLIGRRLAQRSADRFLLDLSGRLCDAILDRHEHQDLFGE